MPVLFFPLLARSVALQYRHRGSNPNLEHKEPKHSCWFMISLFFLVKIAKGRELTPPLCLILKKRFGNQVIGLTTPFWSIIVVLHLDRVAVRIIGLYYIIWRSHNFSCRIFHHLDILSRDNPWDCNHRPCLFLYH